LCASTAWPIPPFPAALAPKFVDGPGLALELSSFLDARDEQEEKLVVEEAIIFISFPPALFILLRKKDRTGP